MTTRARFCQRCGFYQILNEHERPRPCDKCGGVNFGPLPIPVPRHPYELTDEDRAFLHSNRIDPEDER